MIGCFTRGAFDLFMAFVPDQQNLEVVAREAHCLAVDLRHERTRRIDRLEVAVSGRRHHCRRHTVSAEDHVRALGNLVDFLDEDGTLALEFRDDVDVVHDLLAHIDRRTEPLERLLHRDHRAVDTGAVAARRRQQHPLVSLDRDILKGLAPPRNTGNGHADGRTR